MKVKYILLLMICVWGCSGKEVSGNPSNKVIRILFVGNSLTYTNDLPLLVCELGKADSILIGYKTIAKPDYSLDDHLAEGIVQSEISNGRYDFVIVQQGPSALPESQAILMSAVNKYKALCDQTKTKLALYMVWPSKSRISDLDNVIYSYSNAGKKHNVAICAAGLAWKKTWAANTGISLYGADGFHPELAGSLLAAMVIYGTITGNKQFNEQVLKNAFWSRKLSISSFNSLRQVAIAAIETKL